MEGTGEELVGWAIEVSPIPGLGQLPATGGRIGLVKECAGLPPAPAFAPAPAADRAARGRWVGFRFFARSHYHLVEFDPGGARPARHPPRATRRGRG